MTDTPSVEMRKATRHDLPEIVRMLADDVIGAQRERSIDPLPDGYVRAFDAITSDPNNELVVASLGDRSVGTLQLTFIPGLSSQGRWRAIVHAVRVDSAHRSRGIGSAMMRWVIDRARARGCSGVQLTTDKVRTDAHRFYERLGFVASHEGMKLLFPE